MRHKKRKIHILESSFIFVFFLGFSAAVADKHLIMPAMAFAAEEAYVAEAGPDNVQRVEVTAGSHFFRPEHIIVKAGVPVVLTIRNESKVVPHDFVMKSPEAGMDISEELSELSTTIRFTPARPGRYAFWCDQKLLFFKSHREKGMEGVMEVR